MIKFLFSSFCFSPFFGFIVCDGHNNNYIVIIIIVVKGQRCAQIAICAFECVRASRWFLSIWLIDKKALPHIKMYKSKIIARAAGFFSLSLFA